MSNIKQNQEPRDENGKRHGEWIDYWNNGQLWYRSNYVHGVAHGLDEEYNEDGTLWFRGYRNMGREIGYWVVNDKQKYYLRLI